MAFNPWLLTWEIVNPNNTVPDNLIAAVLPHNTGEATIHRFMYVCYCNLGGYLCDQVLYAQRKNGFKVYRYGPLQEFHLGSSPSLFARQVWNYVITEDEVTGDETATWEDRSPTLKDGYPTGFYTMRKKTYDKAKNVIESEAPVQMPYPPRKVK